MPHRIASLALALALLGLLLAAPARASMPDGVPLLHLGPEALESLRHPERGPASVHLVRESKSGPASQLSLQPIPLRAPRSLDVASGSRASAPMAYGWIGDDGTHRVGLRLGANGSVRFAVASIDGRLHRLQPALRGDIIELGLPLRPGDQAPGFECLAEASTVATLPTGIPPLASLMGPDDVRRWQAKGGGTPGFEAVVGVHVDAPFMSGRFGDQQSTASDWLDDLFLATNVFYMRDLALRLVRGHTVYETGGSDPFGASSNVFGSESLSFLSEFGAYWQANFAAEDRAFAVIMSGRRAAGRPTGVAWVGEYCEDGYAATVNSSNVTVGSYSVNLFVPTSNIAAEDAAELFGHELGHNLGAIHNHCVDSDGDPGNGFQPIDRCSTFQEFGADACNQDTPSCPTSNGGRGLLMSSCGNVDGGTGCGPRVLEFHPAQIAIVGSNIASNSPSCLAPVTFQVIDPDRFFYSGFEAGETPPD